ncbi:MAG TPA: Hsp20/alpha crystallin family protein [Anaerolineaceae bacterium]|nr:Hsp20/alpha crystallin family protein [Anaerolineaceae bacterium]
MTINNFPIRRRGDRLTLRRANEEPMMAIQNEMNRMFDQFFTDPFTLLPIPGTRLAAEFSPRVDISETDTEVKVVAELPGMDEKDINLSLEDNALILSGEKKSDVEEKGKTFHRVERTYGSFQRVIPLNVEVDEDKANASFKNGVLTITLPKAAEAVKQAKKITIKKE